MTKKVFHVFNSLQFVFDLLTNFSFVEFFSPVFLTAEDAKAIVEHITELEFLNPKVNLLYLIFFFVVAET